MKCCEHTLNPHICWELFWPNGLQTRIKHILTFSTSSVYICFTNPLLWLYQKISAFCTSSAAQNNIWNERELPVLFVWPSLGMLAPSWSVKQNIRWHIALCGILILPVIFTTLVRSRQELGKKKLETSSKWRSGSTSRIHWSSRVLRHKTEAPSPRRQATLCFFHSFISFA